MRRVPLLAGAAAACLFGAGVAVSGASSAAPPSTPTPAPPTSAQQTLARQALPAGDGWAAATTGTTGGAAADADHVFVVSSRAQLVAALGGDNATNATNATPKIIFIKGRINANEDDAGKIITCDQYSAGTGYDLATYLATYDPAVWGLTTKVSGPAEDARAAAAKNQSKQVQLKVGSNTTIIGLGAQAKFVGGTFSIDKADNVIVRNIKFSDAADCFPQWTPTDNNPAPAAPGNWNSAYDNITLIGATHVWLDHNSFTDQPNPDSDQPIIFNRPLQVHDGATDITNASDYVTLSWNDYADHDKTHIIGSSNTSKIDPGKLHVTLHHNRYTNTLQRTPRVRFGQVDVYNNFFLASDKKAGVEQYVYGLGVGVSSAIVAENNYYNLGDGYTAGNIIFNWGGTDIVQSGNWAKIGSRSAKPVDLLAEYNAENPTTQLGSTVTWTPTLRTTVNTALEVQKLVPANVGVGKIDN